MLKLIQDILSRNVHIKPTVVFECFVFEFWVLRFRDFGVFVFEIGCFVFEIGCFVFEIWVLRFRVLGASFSRFGCFVFEFWVLRFRVLGASFSSFGCFVLRSSISSASFSKLPI